MNKQDEYQKCCLDLWHVLQEHDSYAVGRKSLLTMLITMYCMAECIPDAVKDFRDDIPIIEDGIRKLFGAVDQLVTKGRELEQ